MNVICNKFIAVMLIILTMLLPFRVMAMQSVMNDADVCTRMVVHAAVDAHDSMCSDCQQAGCTDHKNCANDDCHSCGHFASALPMVFVYTANFISESHHTSAEPGELLNQVFPLLRPPRV